MSMKRAGLALAVAVLLLLCSADRQTSQACSGMFMRPWQERLDLLIKDHDAIVVGQYVDIDAANANGIFRVDEYWFGGGPQHLLIHNATRHELNNARLHRRPTTGCGPFGARPVLGTDIYVYTIRRDATGQYHPEPQWFVFEDVQSLGQARFSNVESLSLSLDVLRAHVMAHTGRRPQLPDAQAPYPRTTPILLITEHDQSFLMPIDSLTPMPVPADQRVHLLQRQHSCDAPPCVVYSPNGMDSIDLNAPGKMIRLAQYRGFDHETHRVVGQRVGISPTSDVYVLWHDDHIQVFALWYPRNGYTFFRRDFRRPVPPQKVNVTLYSP